jgi:hypothetical protein
MGHPQPPTPIFCDNEVAIGLANGSVTLKMSKSLDMRFHWLRDRIQQGHFRVLFIPGAVNIADFFTKALPVIRHRVLAPFSAVDPDNEDTQLFSNKLNIEGGNFDDFPFKANKLLISSGSLFNLNILKKINWNNVKYFVDGVDYEFCLRANKMGYLLQRIGSAARPVSHCSIPARANGRDATGAGMQGSSRG